jgi:hypothetical protein
MAFLTGHGWLPNACGVDGGVMWVSIAKAKHGTLCDPPTSRRLHSRSRKGVKLEKDGLYDDAKA